MPAHHQDPGDGSPTANHTDVVRTAAQVRQALMGRWPVTEYLHIAEAPMRSDRGGRKLDVVVVSLWASRGLQLDGVEIKVSMSDWKRELDNPDKADWWWRHVHRFWIAAPADVAKKIKPQLPPNWGLLSVSDTGVRALVTPEPNRKPEPFTWGETVGLLRASADFGVAASQREYDRGRDDQRKMMEAAAERNGGVDPAAGRKLAHVAAELERLRSQVAAFEETSGLTITNGWGALDAQRIGSLVKLVRSAILQGPDVIAGRVAHQAEQARGIADVLDKLGGALAGAFEAEGAAR